MNSTFFLNVKHFCRIFSSTMYYILVEKTVDRISQKELFCDFFQVLYHVNQNLKFF